MLAFNTPRRIAPNTNLFPELFFRQQPGIQAIVEVVAIVGDFIGEIGNLRLQRRQILIRKCLPDVARASSASLILTRNLPGEIQSRKNGDIFLFQFFNDAEALPIMLESAIPFH